MSSPPPQRPETGSPLPEDPSPVRPPDYAPFRFRRSKRWAPLRRYLVYLFTRGVMAGAQRLSLARLQGLGRGFGRLGLRLQPKLADIARTQLALVFPEQAPAAREQLVRECFENMGMTAFEAMAVQRLRRKPGDWLSAEGEAHLREAYAQGRGVIMLTAHSANWELISVLMERLQLPAVAVVRTHNNPRLNRLLIENRANPYLQTLERGSPSAPRQLLSALKRGEILVVAIDQDIEAQGVWAEFFGIPANTPRVAASLALRARAPVVTGFDTRRADGSHVFVFDSVPVGEEDRAAPDPELALTRRFNQRIEAHIRAWPAQWCWHHRRWKRRPKEEAAPAPDPSVEADTSTPPGEAPRP